MNQLSFVKKQGKSILEIAEDFAQLRIAVFKDFPYLYEGTLEYELDYIQTYSSSEEAFIFAVYDGNQMIGATTCIPLIYETENVQQPFINNGIDCHSVFYFGESILLKQYRGQGLGHRFFDEREAYAKTFEGVHLTAFCAVNREENHPLKPVDYIPNDVFWSKRGYTKHPELTCEINWQDVNEVSDSPKTLTFWLKEFQ
jgi:GNAT superfamily N-acetyltransferase